MLYRSSRTGFNRVPFVAGCTLELDGELLSGVTCNLSVLGLYLNIDPLPPQGAHVRVCFRLPDGGDPIEGEARVTWVNDEPVRAIGDLPPGCGLRFVSLDPSHLKRLASVIAAFQYGHDFTRESNGRGSPAMNAFEAWARSISFARSRA